MRRVKQLIAGLSERQIRALIKGLEVAYEAKIVEKKAKAEKFRNKWSKFVNKDLEGVDMEERVSILSQMLGHFDSLTNEEHSESVMNFGKELRNG